MGKAPTVCRYCDGTGSCDGFMCGFCDEGKPLDTQADWDASWGNKIFAEDLEEMLDSDKTGT